MATVEQLKEEIANADAEVARLTPAFNEAKTAENAAQAALDAFYAKPKEMSLSKLAALRKAVEDNPRSMVAQSALNEAQAKWNAQQSEFTPLLKARDDAVAATIEARKPIVAAEERAAQADMAIAKIDPSQASPDAVAAVKEQEQGPAPKAPVEDASTNNTAASSDLPTSEKAVPTVVSTTVEEGATTEHLSDGTIRVITDDGTVTKYDSNLNPVTEDPTNPSQADADTEEKYKNASATDDGSDPYYSNGESTIAPPEQTYYENDGSSSSSAAPSGLPVGGVNPKSSKPAAEAQWPDAKDVRAILKVPQSYITSITDPDMVLKTFGGIVFPYTPQISFEHSATYNGVNPTHSNYTQYFYKNSAVSAISVNAKFTVQNETDAIILVGVITLLRALTKMKFGPDKDAGAPPPVCRFSAYGNFMLSNVPVTVASFRHDLPDGVDYFQTNVKYKSHGLNFVPVLSTISLTLNPTYSRSEMMRAGVSNTLNGKTQKAGFL